MQLLKLSFIVGVLFTFSGAFLKIINARNAEPILIVGVFASYIYAIQAIFDIIRTTRMHRREKIMWIITFIFMNSFTGMVYFIFNNKRIKV